MRTYGKLTLHAAGSYWYMHDTEPHVNIKLKSIFTKIGKMAVSPFEFENTQENCADLLWFTQRYPMQITDEDQAALEAGSARFYQTQAHMEAILCPDYVPPSYAMLKDGQGMRHYQTQATEVLHHNGVLLCGDEVGLGKTYVGIGAAAHPEHLPAAIVVQSHLPRQWKEKLESFSHLRVHVIKKTRSYPLPEADVYIFRYTCLGGWIETFRTGYFKLAVFDEVQELRTGTGTVKGQGASHLCQNVQWSLGLTATPVYNYGDEMWNIMNILKPNCLGSWEDFCREWAGNSYGGKNVIIKDPKALGAYLREKYLFLRRTRAEVGKELAPVNKIVETVGYDEATLKTAEDLAKQLAVRAATGSFMERGQAARELDMMMRKWTGVSKAKHVAEFVKILLDNGEPVVLAGWHREVYDIWLEELKEYRPVMYTGSESPKQKNDAVEAFNSGESNLFILSLRSGVGIDGLQHRCSTVVFGELDWSPAVHHQLIGRLDREGQLNQVMAIFLCSDSGSDPLLIDLLGLKGSQAQGIIDPHLGIQEIHSDESRLQMLVKKYLQGKNIQIPAAMPPPAPAERQGSLFAPA